mgnify:FL=1|tara:strand:+ start:195 stop:566 length:372 start_codon:yes stop_codon:yes gene_type:complete
MKHIIDHIKTEIQENTIRDNVVILATTFLVVLSTLLLLIVQITIRLLTMIVAISKEVSHASYVFGKLSMDTMTKVSKKYVWKRTNKLGPNSTVGSINGQYENSQLENAMKTPVDIEAIRKRGF